MSLRDNHSYSFSKPSSRIKAPAYGNANRTLPFIDVTCPQCEADLADRLMDGRPRYGWTTDIEKVEPTLAESDWSAGKNQKSKTTLEALSAQLDELMADSE
jgi:hypothetical protein